MKPTIIIGVIVIALANLYWPVRSVYKDYQKHLFLEQAEAKYKRCLKSGPTHSEVYSNLRYALSSFVAVGQGNSIDAKDIRSMMSQIEAADMQEIEAATKAIEKLRREMLK